MRSLLSVLVLLRVPALVTGATTTSAEWEIVASDKYCAGRSLSHTHGTKPAGNYASQEACQDYCKKSVNCNYYLFRHDPRAKAPYTCATFASCSSANTFGDGDGGHIYRKPGSTTMKKTTTTSTPGSRTTNYAPVCDDWRWKRAGGRCYHFFKVEHWLRYDQMQAKCKEHGAQLARIDNEQQNKVALEAAGTFRATIGLNDIKKEGTFVWANETAANYTNWEKEEPNNHFGEHCVAISHVLGKKWNDVRCGHPGLSDGILCSAIVPPPQKDVTNVNNATWRVRVTQSAWQTAYFFPVYELEFLTSTDCDPSSKFDMNPDRAISSGTNWPGSLPRAFDGNVKSRWNGVAGLDYWEHLDHPWYSLRYIGGQDLPPTIGCVRIYVDNTYLYANVNLTVAVEKLDPSSGRWTSWGPAWGKVHHPLLADPSVSAPKGGKWNEIVLAGPAHAYCGQDEHVVGGRCVLCPRGLTNAAGDDTDTPGGTACDVVDVNSFEVKHTEGAKFATRSQPTRREARMMHTASCGGDKVLVGFTTQTSFPGYRSCTISNYFGTTTATNCEEEPDETSPWRPRGSIFPVGGFQGHVALYQRNSDGSLRELQRVHLPFCEEMGTVTATADCSVLAALCITRTQPKDMPNLKNDLIEDNKIPESQMPARRKVCLVNQSFPGPRGKDAIWKQCEYPTAFYEDPVAINKPDWIAPDSRYFKGNYTGGAWFYDTREAYILEWHTGSLSEKPDATARVNSAVGGARYGSFELHINADASLYFVDVKCTIFGRGDLNYHEGDCSLNVKRTKDGGFEWFNRPLPASPAAKLQPVGSGWGAACGRGHTTWHVAKYNSALDQWGRWCWTDSHGGNQTGYPGRGFGSWFRIAGEHDRAEVYRNYVVPWDDVNGMLGQPSDITPFGKQGWVAVLTAHVPQPGGEKVWPHVTKIKKLGIAMLPSTGAKGMIAAGQTGGVNNAVVFLESLRPEGKGLGWAKLVHIGNSPDDDRFLLGYVVFEPAGPPYHYDFPNQFMLVEVTHNGTLLTEPVRVDNAGWTLQSTWSVIDGTRGRCAVWPNAWADVIDPLGRGPSNWYGQYGAYDAKLRKAGVQHIFYSSTLRLMTYCPDDISDRMAGTTPAGTTTTTKSSTKTTPVASTTAAKLTTTFSNIIGVPSASHSPSSYLTHMWWSVCVLFLYILYM